METTTNEINNTMTQENRQELWCSQCENECTSVCKYCVFAGCPTRYKFKKPSYWDKQFAPSTPLYK